MLLLKLALRPWRLAPYSQLFSAFAVGFLLLLAGMLFWLQQGLRPVLTHLKQEQVITAYINANVDSTDDSRIVDEIHVALGAHAERSAIHLVETNEFVSHIKKSYPELGREIEDLGPEMATVVPRYVSISGPLIDSALERVRAIPGIESAESSRDHNKSALGAFSALRWVAEILSAGLCLALLTGLIHLARTNSYIHRDALSLLRLLGADSGSLQLPGVFSAFCVGTFGGLLALGGWLTAAVWLSRQIRYLSPILKDMPLVNPLHGVVLLLLGSCIGFLAGIFGCLTQKEA